MLLYYYTKGKGREVDWRSCYVIEKHVHVCHTCKHSQWGEGGGGNVCNR